MSKERASFEQIQYWFSSKKKDKKSQEILHVIQNFDHANIIDIKESIRILINTYSVFRTRFVWEKKCLYQFIDNTYEANRIFHCKSKKNNFNSILKTIINPIASSIYVDNKFLSIFVLIEHEESTTLLVLIHHIICDAWGAKIIKERCRDIYNTILNKKKYTNKESFSLLDYSKHQYNDFIRMQEVNKKYWLNKLNYFLDEKLWYDISIPPFALISKNKNNIKNWINNKTDLIKIYDDDKYYKITTIISKHDTVTINEICKSIGISIYSIFNFIFLLFPNLFRIARPVLLCSPISNRFSTQTRNLIGSCGGTIYSTYMEEGNSLSIKDILKKMHFTFIKDIKSLIYIHSLIDINPMQLRVQVDLFFNLIPKEFNFDIKAEEYKLNRPIPSSKQFYPLSCYLIEANNKLYFNWVYNAHLYNKDTIIFLAEYVSEMLSFIKNNLHHNFNNM